MTAVITGGLGFIGSHLVDALLAAGVLALVGVRRRRRLRAAMPRHRVPEPREDIARTERTLRTIDAGERVMRADVACRAAARSSCG